MDFVFLFVLLAASCVVHLGPQSQSASCATVSPSAVKGGFGGVVCLNLQDTRVTKQGVSRTSFNPSTLQAG
jgi:hypothetical protein